MICPELFLRMLGVQREPYILLRLDLAETTDEVLVVHVTAGGGIKDVEMMRAVLTDALAGLDTAEELGR